MQLVVTGTIIMQLVVSKGKATNLLTFCTSLSAKLEAQLELGKSSRSWFMPDLSFVKRRGDVLFAFIDTTPMYYSEQELSYFKTDFSTAHAQVESHLTNYGSVCGNV